MITIDEAFKLLNRKDEESCDEPDCEEAENEKVDECNNIHECDEDSECDDENCIEDDNIEIVEDVNSSLPVHPLPTSEVKDFILNLPTPTPTIPPKFFKLGYIKEFDKEIASKFRGGRGSSADTPFVRIFKCTEYSSLYTGSDWRGTNATKQADKILGTERHTGEKTGFSFGGENAVVNKIGRYADGSEALQAYISDNSRQKVKFYISLNDEDLRPADKAEVAQYLTGAVANRLLTPGSARVAAGVDAEGNKVFDKPINRFKLTNIYMIGNLGHSVMGTNEDFKDVNIEDFSDDEFKDLFDFKGDENNERINYTIRDLYDQVYSSLTDSGNNATYMALGDLNGKGRYEVDQIYRGPIDLSGKFDVICVTSDNLDPAKEIAKTYGLKFRENAHKNVLFIYIPVEAPANFNLLAPNYKDRVIKNTLKNDYKSGKLWRDYKAGKISKEELRNKLSELGIKERSRPVRSR